MSVGVEMVVAQVLVFGLGLGIDRPGCVRVWACGVSFIVGLGWFCSEVEIIP